MGKSYQTTSNISPICFIMFLFLLYKRAKLYYVLKGIRFTLIKNRSKELIGDK